MWSLQGQSRGYRGRTRGASLDLIIKFGKHTCVTNGNLESCKRYVSISLVSADKLTWATYLGKPCTDYSACLPLKQKRIWIFVISDSILLLMCHECSPLQVRRSCIERNMRWFVFKNKRKRTGVWIGCLNVSLSPQRGGAFYQELPNHTGFYIIWSCAIERALSMHCGRHKRCVNTSLDVEKVLWWKRWNDIACISVF